MMNKSVPIAKITRPKVSGVLPRTQLFRRLDKGRGKSVVWISGPAGSGKTILAASYAAARKLTCLWYQADAGDADIATFFYYMGLAARTVSPGKRRPLPLFTPEYRLGIRAFTRRYFEDLYSRLPSPCAIVFDNCHEVESSSQFHDVIRDGLSALPAGISVILISRSEPPPSLARLRAAGRMELIGWSEMMLTPQESRGIIRLHEKSGVSNEAIRRLYELSQGWAAGLALLLERAKAEGPGREAVRGLPLEEVFDYFAGEIFDKTDEKIRAFLLKTAFLPRITPSVAERLTGIRGSGRILSELSRRNYFTERRFHSELVYQYHPLFREFLLNRAKDSFSDDEVFRIQQGAAALLEEAGDIEDAARLYRAAGAWRELGRLIPRLARTFMSHGRNSTLEECLLSLPRKILEKDPGLLYWLGVCRLPFHPAGSRESFERAFSLHRERKDRAGIFLAWAGVVESYTHELGNLKRLDPWISQFSELSRKYGPAPSPEIEDHVASRMFAALAMRRPDHPEFELWKHRAFKVLDRSEDPTLLMLTAFYLFSQHIWSGDYVVAGRLLGRIRAMTGSREASPLARITSKMAQAWYDWSVGRHEECKQAIEEGLKLAEETGVLLWNYLLIIQGIVSCLSKEDADGAEPLFAKLAPILERVRGFDRFYYYHERAWQSLIRSDLSSALSHQKTAVSVAAEVGIAYGEAQAHFGMSRLCHETGDRKSAELHLKKVRHFGRMLRSGFIEYLYLLTRAQYSLDQDEDRPNPRLEQDGLEALRRAIDLGRKGGYTAMLWWWQPKVIAGLLEKALDKGIEPEHVQDLIRKHDLTSDARVFVCEYWPWRLKIYTLGRFELMGGNGPVRFSRKAPRRALDMLKALISFGGMEVAEGRIAEDLWPDAEGDLARQSCLTTIKRLRRLLGEKAVLNLSNGRITLDPRHCWVDAFAFERRVEQADAVWSTTRSHDAEAVRRAEQAIELYKGPFLPNDSDQPWIEPLRERLRRKFIRTLERVGAYHMQAGRHERAVEFFQKGLEVDDLAEEFYKGLMVCYQRMGRRADGLAAYERCRSALSSRLGTETSPETEAVYQRLRKCEK